MAYAFNDNKSKAPVYTKEEQASMIKVVSLSGNISNGGENGRCYIKAAFFTVPTGYTPIGATIKDADTNVSLSIQYIGNGWILNAMVIGTGAATLVDFIAKVYCVRDEYITT